MKYNELTRGLKIIDNIVSQYEHNTNEIDVKIMSFQDGCNGELKQKVEGSIKFPDNAILTVAFTPYHIH